jgi:hypothetical protein
MVEGLGSSSKDQMIPSSSPSCAQSLYLQMSTSAARLVYQRPIGVWIACDSYVE